ncbi:MAG: VCBS domain-containing protein, partial [Deltaproteobacteria bacterium]|nr:VCBS domain-containing protein [Deltaproteobacteria bacterium]
MTHVDGGALVEGAGEFSGTYGYLTVAGGNYTYTAYEGFTNPEGYTPDTFEFTITDGDGDTAAVSATFNVIDNEGPSVEVVAESLTVDESGIDGVDDVAPGDDIGTEPSADTESTNGTLAIDTGGDPYELTVDGTPIPPGGTSIQGLYGDLTINAAGVWSYTLDNNYLGHTAGDPNDLAPGVENFAIEVSDDSGTFPAATTTLTIDILDDGPIAVTAPAAVDVDDGESRASAALASLIAETGADGASVTHVDGGALVEGAGEFSGTYGYL